MNILNLSFSPPQFPSTLTQLSLVRGPHKDIKITLPPLPPSLTYFSLYGWGYRDDHPNLSNLKALKTLKLDVNLFTHVTELPSSIEVLEIKNNSGTPTYAVSVSTLPSSLKKLKTYNCTIPTKVPPLLTKLSVTGNFYQSLDFPLPPTLDHLNLQCINHPVDDLPPSLTHFTSGRHFNQPVDDLPVSITHLCFGAKFNQPVNHLPKFLTHLRFGEKFNYPLPPLPHLTHLLFDVDYSFNQNSSLPPSLTHLFYGNADNKWTGETHHHFSHIKTEDCSSITLPTIERFYKFITENGTFGDSFKLPKTFKQITCEILHEESGEIIMQLDINFETREFLISFIFSVFHRAAIAFYFDFSDIFYKNRSKDAEVESEHESYDSSSEFAESDESE
jgi:hypothetical protein